MYLCSSTRHIARWCCPQWCWGRRCGLRAGSLRSPGEAGSPGSARCHRTTSPARSCPGRPSRPGEAAPRWPAAPRGTRSGLRPTPETTCRRPRSGRLHLEDGDTRQGFLAGLHDIIIIIMVLKERTVKSHVFVMLFSVCGTYCSLVASKDIAY